MPGLRSRRALDRHEAVAVEATFRGGRGDCFTCHSRMPAENSCFSPTTSRSFSVVLLSKETASSLSGAVAYPPAPETGRHVSRCRQCDAAALTSGEAGVFPRGPLPYDT